MDKTTQKLNFVQDKLGKLLKTNDMGQICTIIILFLILIVMIFLVIYTWIIHLISILKSMIFYTNFNKILFIIFTELLN